MSVYHDGPYTHPDLKKDINEVDWEYDEVIKEEYRNHVLRSDQLWRTSLCSKPPSASRTHKTSSASQLIMKCFKEVQHEDLNVTEVINEFVKELNSNDMLYNQEILTSCRG